MRRICPVLFVALLAPAAARADRVVPARGIPYSGVAIEAVKDFRITFKTPTGSPITKALSEIALIEIVGMDEFNRAETLRKAGKWSPAVGLYDQAHRKALGWQRELIRVRQLAALEQGGRIDRAMEEWLKIADAHKGSDASLALRPARLAAKGDRANKKAIFLLERKLARRTLRKKPKYAAAIREVLVALYRREGMDEKIAALKNEASSANGGKQPVPEPPPPAGALSRSVAEARRAMKAGKLREALAIVEANLKRYRMEELPSALLVRAEAQKALADKAGADAKRALLLKAGLDAMRVAALFPSTAEAPEALLLAGEIHLALPKPNKHAARSAFQAVTKRYPDSKVAGRAKRALERAAPGTGG